MQKADLTGYGSTTALMAHSSGEPITTTARGTGPGRTTAPMAHWGGGPTGTTGSGRVLIHGGTLRAELHGRRII
jgi:hypothetical protein